ncbi:MAG: ABC transporter ATP-binding protein [Candidatus Onthovivens sp.]|nr:ABC transporter ATP-binding protein [Candidatus Onthovivens sp.]
MKKVNAYSPIKYFKKEMIFGPLFKMLEVVFELLMPFLMSYIIDDGINFALDTGDFSKIYIPGLIIFGFAVLGLLSTLVCQYFASVASQGYGTKLRNQLFKKITHLSLSDIEIIGKGNLNTIISNDVNRLQVSVAMMIRLVLRAPALIIGSLICAFFIDTKISLIFLVVVISISIILFLIIFNSSKKIIEVQKETDSLVMQANDSLSGMRVVKAFNNEEKEINNFKKKTNQFFIKMKSVNIINALTSPLTSLIINFAIAFVIYFSSSSIIDQTGITKGELSSLISYLNQILLALIVVSNLVVIFTRAFASKKRVEEILNIPDFVHDKNEIKKIDLEDNQNILDFKNVSFKYEEKDNDVIKNINFEIKKGEKVGIIGGTGSGKTTLIKLIERFFTRTSGVILYKGKDINQYNITNLRNEISLVSQKASLFKGTIRSNLEMGKKDATIEEMEESLKMSCAYEFVKKYDDYLDHKVEEGGKNFSGGQKQRLSIARSLIKDSEILILDDSTSALDYLTEKLLKENINKMEDKTVIIVAQRVSTVKNCDKIIVMYHGSIESIGTHEELLANSKVYKEIYDSQYQK